MLHIDKFGRKVYIDGTVPNWYSTQGGKEMKEWGTVDEAFMDAALEWVEASQNPSWQPW